MKGMSVLYTRVDVEKSVQSSSISLSNTTPTFRHAASSEKGTSPPREQSLHHHSNQPFDIPQTLRMCRQTIFYRRPSPVEGPFTFREKGMPEW